MKLLGRMLEGIELDAGGRLVVATVALADLAATGAHPMDTEDFVGQLTTVHGADAALLLIEQPGGAATKASFRSRGAVDCSAFAERWGGGGHRAAAGATVRLPLAEAARQLCAELVLALAAPQ